MRLLFVHEVDWVNKVKYEIHELPELLSLRGFEVDFIDFPEDSQTRNRFATFRLRLITRRIRSHTYLGSQVQVVSPGRILLSPFDRLLATVTFLPVLLKMIWRRKYDAIILYSVPTNGWQTVLVARLMGIPVIFRALDVSHLIRKTRMKRLVLLAERFIYRRANWLSANNAALLEYCVGNGADPEKSSVNYPGLELAHFRPSGRSHILRESLDVSGEDKVMIFLGTLFNFCGLDRIISDFAEPDVRDLKVKLVILGDGEFKHELQKLAKSLNLEPKVKFVGRVDFSQIGDYLSCADVAVMPFKSETVAEMALPWKVVQYVAAGLPVVASPLKGLRSAFPPGHGIQYLSQYENAVKTMYDLSHNHELVDQLVEYGQQIVQSKFLWESNIVEFEGLIRGVVREFAVKQQRRLLPRR